MAEARSSLDKKRAKELRKRGVSYGQIFKETGIPKSTLSSWLKDFKLSKKHRDRLYTGQIQLITSGKYGQKIRRQREVELIIKKAKNAISSELSDEAIRFMGVALYWAEGTKKHRFTITNSDPALILFMVKWVEKIFNIPPQDLTACLNIHKQQDNELIKSFWSDLLRIPMSSFGKSYIKPDGTGYKKNDLYWGTIKISIPKSTDLKLQMLGWLEAVLPDVRKRVEFIKQKYLRP